MGYKISILLGLFSFQILLRASVGHSHEGKLGDIEFSCPNGGYFTGGYCISVIDVPMIWSEADRTCRRQGQYLMWVDDADEYKSIDHLARRSWEYYWTGLNRHGDVANNTAHWSNADKEEVNLESGLWENGQPNLNDGKCGIAKKRGKGLLGNCLRKLPFVCKTEAVLTGYFRCRNGRGIQMKFKCDGHNDCHDNSDEVDCSSICANLIDAQYAVNATKPSGMIVGTGNTFYSNNKTCSWSIVTNIGSTIRVKVESFATEKNADVMDFRTGGMAGEIVLGELTGNASPLPTFYSSDNVFQMRFLTDSTIINSGFSISWTTDVPEVFNDLQMLPATDTVKDLKSPLYDTEYLPHEKVFEWVITASSDNVVTLQFENIDIDDKGKLYLWDGDDVTLTPTLTLNTVPTQDIFISRSKSVRLMLMSGSDSFTFSKGIYIKYWQGCNVNIMANKGYINSPGYTSGSYPDKVNCTWIIQRNKTESRALSLKFLTFQVQPESDYLKIYNDTGDDSPLHSGNGFNGSDSVIDMTISSKTGYIRVMFTTNYVLTSMGFSAQFSLDCPQFTVSSQTQVMYTEERVFGSITTLTCDNGYSFVQEEFNQQSSVSMECQYGGDWDKPRVPNCMINYCPIPPSVANGYIIQSSGVKYGGNVTYKCNDGFFMDGTEDMNCKSDGTWEVDPTCNADGCSAVGVLENGAHSVLVGNGVAFASVVQYECDPGYETYGNITKYCKTGGMWSHTPPTCEKIFCPVPMFPHGSVSQVQGVVYEMTITLTCDAGFGINGSSTVQTQILKCESDRKFTPFVSCMDVNECNLTSPICPASEDCHNTMGNHMCTCKPGYERLSTDADCTDINECTPNGDRGPCDQTCDNTPTPGYTCSCGMSGYILYTGDGFNNISLAKGETGMRDGDVYRINHTCVRKQCQVPAPITNGVVLSKKDLFYYNDVIQFTCNHGYLLSGSAVTNTRCSENGAWADDIPTCTRATCTTPTMITIPRSVNIYPGESTSVLYGEVVHIECQYGSKRINRTLYCSYKGNEMYSLQGDSAECPEINCGMPEKPAGGEYTGLTSTSLGDTFTFGCDVGFSMTGMSEDGTDNVTCQENGRWNIGNLTCTGSRCTDPDTPGGAKQIVDSYEVGKVLSFKCDTDGYFPDSPDPWECIVDTTTNNNTVKWNTTYLPECIDKTPPVFTNCPGSPIYIEKTEEYSYPDPVATDNSNAVLILNPGGYRPTGLRSNSDIMIQYIAMDFSNNTAYCNINIKIKENIKPTLHCPAHSEIVLISKAEGKSVNMSDYINVTFNGNYNVTFSPAQFVTFNHSTIGVLKKIDVKAEAPWGAEDRCSFLVGTKADACFRESFPMRVPNGGIECTSGNIKCTVTCDSGYTFNDGNKTKTYDCHSTNVWTPALPVDTCIKYDEPSYIIILQVAYKSEAVSSLCVNGHKQMLINNKQNFTQEIFSICNSDSVTVGAVEITKMESTTSSFSYITVFEIKLLEPTILDANSRFCSLYLGAQAETKSTFLQYSSSVSCDDSGSTQVNRSVPSNKNKLISHGNMCSAGVQKHTDDGEKCVPCPPGTFSSPAGDTCTECPDGKFQDGFGQTTCKSCPENLPVPSADKKTCVGVCPPGFFSATGVPPCDACPENNYWVNETQCQMCPNSGSTLGVNAVEDKDGCKLPCEKGKYSLFGYTPCTDCPVNHYQDETKQGSCKPCASNEITQGTGATDSVQCIALGWTPSNIGTACCDACPGKDNACCQANCSQEISSRTCDNRCNDGYNRTAVCQCTSQCITDGNCCPDYMWKCVDQTITCETTNCAAHGTCKYKNHKRFCECNTGYKGDNCEIELDPCDSNPCWNGGTCIKTGIDSYNCSCPVDTSCKMVRQNGKIGIDADWQKSGITPFRSENLTIEYCEDRCFKNQRCIAVHYTSKFCFIYYEISTIEDNANSVLSEKKCTNTPLFGCDRCEFDLVNSCEADTCSEHGMCQNLVSQDKATCLCPTTGVYTGDRCEQDIDLCSNPNPCQHGAVCESYGSVRYQCICPDGYTGKNCETNIDECDINPDGCLNNGTCNDGVNKYMCTCVTGFSGDICKDVPDFCEKQNPCPTGICYNNYDTFEYMCKCEDPYRNDNSGTCEMIPNCETDNCINGTCDSSDGECDCVTGFEGSLCQHNIDDCARMPCQHSGTCTDELNDYECQCPTGYDGKDCDNDIDDCVDMCTDDNAVKNGCVDRLNDYTCTCKPGYMGKNCTEDVYECLSYPCKHSGTCENQENDFTCNCTEGWTGKTCDTPMDFCNPSPCKNGGICYNLTDGYFCKCQKGTTGDTCNNFPEVCNVTTPCINSGTCNDESGTAKCTCSDNYDGTSCQLINDQCNDTSTCKNSGTCVTKDMGYTCDCKDGYSGDNCLTYTDPCSSSPCHSNSTCKSEETRYMCYCTHGEVLTDTGCKATDDNFDIFMDSMIPDAHAFLRNPLVVMPNSSLTIMFWTRVIKTTEDNFTLLALEPVQIGTILPVYNPSLWIGTIKNNEFVLNSTIPFKMDVADGKWHFIALSWELTGRTKIFIDAIKIYDEMSVGANALPETLQVILGLGAYGRISKLNIYKEALSDSEMIRAYENYDHLPFDQLVQGWSNIVLSDSVTRIFPSSVGNEDICDIGIKQGCPGEDRTNPTVECPADQYKNGTSRLTPFTGLQDLGTYSADVTNKSYSIHTDEVYTYGSTNEVLVGYDEDGNYGICRFKVYVKYNADCPAPKTDSTVIYCSGSSGNICELDCPAGSIPSMIHPKTYSCGQLGLYDNYHPNKNFVLPTCGVEKNQTLALTVNMTYKLLINCQEAAAMAIKADVTSMIKGDVAANWPDLCKSCTPEVHSKCQSGQFLDVNFTITNLGTTTNKNGVTYKMREAILIVILQENRFHFPDIVSSELQDNTVIVLENPSCPTDYVVLGDTCVQCGKGTYRNDITMSCQFCPVGKYQESPGATSCTDCPSGETTQTFGSYSSSDCKGDCPVGQYYNDSNSRCEDCQKHYYQDMTGQDHCLPCRLGRKTSSKGSNSSSSCYVDCLAGTELQANGSCKECERGFYRSQADDNCLSCKEIKPGMTTEKSGAKTSTNCKIRICYAGNYRNATSNDCQPCPVGEYQSKDLQDTCEECPTDHTTDGEGKTHKDNCTFYCPPGREVLSAIGKTCRLCPRGTYRSHSENEILEPCQNCIAGNTTETTERTRADECSIQKCKAGQKLDDTGACVDCQVDSYQDEELPDSNTQCMPCTVGKGTMNPKSTNQDQCVVICSEGEQNDVSSCSPCPQGTWRNGNMTMRFEQCYNCTQDYTTVGMSSTHPDNCTLRDCNPGYYISGSSCLPCKFGQYQPKRHQEMCLNCSTNQNTSVIASTSQSYCQIYCPKGQEGNVSCTMCQMNYIKPVAGISACSACEGNFTANADRDDCSQIHCDRGFYYENDNCTACPVGRYKDMRGNANSCTACDDGFTTSSVASYAKIDCSVYDCQPGYRRKAGGCAECEKGTYQTERAQPSCIDCPSGNTTESTRSTKEEQCIKKCTDCMEYNYGTHACDNCPQGFRTIRPKTERCVQCPSGQTTSHAGDNNCYENSITAPIPLLTTINLILVFQVTFDCQHSDTLENFKGLAGISVITQLTVLAVVYPLLCSSTSCTNINSLEAIIDSCVLAPVGRRRAVADNIITFSFQVPDVPSVVTNNQSGSSRPTRSVLQQDLTVNMEQYNPVPSIFEPVNATVGVSTLQCPAGYEYNSGTNKCDCSTGTMYDSATKQCKDCARNTFKSSIDQTTCTACSGNVKKYTLAEGSNSSSDCVSDCVLTPTYCNTGTCTEDMHSVYCTCPDNFEGVRCQAKKVTESKNPAIIGGAIGGGVGLLIFILIIILVCSKLRSRNKSDNGSDSKKFSRIYDGDIDAPYKNPIYHNRAYQGQLPIAYPSSGEWSNDGYHQDPYAQYRYPNMRHVDNEDEAFYSFRGSTGGSQHEWNAA